MKGKLVMARLVMMIRSLLEIMTKILKTIYWGYLGQEKRRSFWIGRKIWPPGTIKAVKMPAPTAAIQNKKEDAVEINEDEGKTSQ